MRWQGKGSTRAPQRGRREKAGQEVIVALMSHAAMHGTSTSGDGGHARTDRCDGGEYGGFSDVTWKGKDTEAERIKERRERFDPKRGAEGKNAAQVATEYLGTIQDGSCKDDGEMIRFFADSGVDKVSSMVTVKDVPADGSCLFHALAASTTQITEEAAEMRKTAINEIEQNPERYRHAVQVVLEEKREAQQRSGRGGKRSTTARSEMVQYDMDQYLQQAARSDFWADDILMSATATSLNIEIRRYSGVNGESTISPMFPNHGTRVTHVYHHGNTHYMAVVLNEGVHAISDKAVAQKEEMEWIIDSSEENDEGTTQDESTGEELGGENGGAGETNDAMKELQQHNDRRSEENDGMKDKEPTGAERVDTHVSTQGDEGEIRPKFETQCTLLSPCSITHRGPPHA